MIALRLALRQWLARPLRPVLCSLAIAAAVALIVAVGAGFDSLRATVRHSQAEVLGNADLFVRRFFRGLQYRIKPDALDLLRKQSGVKHANPRLEGHLRIFKPGDSPGDHVPYDAIGFDPASDEVLHPKTFTAGGPPKGDDEIVIDETASHDLKAGVGDAVTVDGMAGHTRRAKIAGVIRRPALDASSRAFAFVPAAAMARDLGMPALEYNLIEVTLASPPAPGEQDAVAKAFNDVLGKDFNVTAAQTRKDRYNKQSQAMDFIVLAISVVSGLCATLIIATTLSVGVQERLRQFGQLRCVGASRLQLVSFLASDAALLTVLGVLLGVVVGYVGSRTLILHYPKIFSAYVISPKSVVTGLLNGGLATLLGAAIPAWQIARVSPMEAVAAAGRPARARGVWLSGAVGLLLLAFQAAMWLAAPNRDVRFWSYVTLGIPMIFVGYCLLGPAALLGLQHVGARALGGLMAVRPALLTQAWSRTPWRAGGMIAALMIGVVMYASVRQRSEGLIASWDFPKVFPDVILFSGRGGPFDDVMKLKTVEGVTAATALSVGTAKLDTRVFGSGEVLNSGNTRFAAVDPDTFGAMVELEFLQGKPAEAMARLKQGRAILVSQEFHNARGINKGGKVPFKTRDGTVDFEVAGVVKSSGIEMMQSFFDLTGNMHEEAVSSVIGTLDDAKTYFGFGTVNVALVNMELRGRTPAKAVELLRDRANGQRALKKAGAGLLGLLGDAKAATAPAPSTAPGAASASGATSAPAASDVGGGALAAFVGTISQALNWQATSVIEIKEHIGAAVARMVTALTTIAIAGMCVASLGVANMVIASMHARSYEFGILRAIGTGRGQLLRMVLAEITLASLVAGTLGSIAGLHFTYMGTRVDRLLVGYVTPFVTPEMLPRMAWHVFVGVAVTVLLGWLTAVLPAARTAFRPQRELLAQGRS